MLTFRDDQKLINIRILTIYFMLTEQERVQYKIDCQYANIDKFLIISEGQHRA